jgi:putative ABC transport system substrate-binding protein
MAQQGVEALIVGSSQENSVNGRVIVELAEIARLPTLYPGRWYVEQGGLMSYGADLPELYRQLGADIAEILKGAKPGDIPFYQPMRFELVINLKTAKALGLVVPQSLLARADEVIE